MKTLNQYLEFVVKTDKLPDVDAAVQGLFGEIGSIMSASKKIKREGKDVFTGFKDTLVEEFGDAFWYLCYIAFKSNVDLISIYKNIQKDSVSSEVLIGGDSTPLALAYTPGPSLTQKDSLVKLGQQASHFLTPENITNSNETFSHFLKTYFDALHIFDVSFEDVIRKNVKKVSSRFIPLDISELPDFDAEYEEFEQLPREFEIEFMERAKGVTAMRWNGVFIGDPLTDSIADNDDYRYHDVFHFAYAAILHWSPTIRSLIKHKRKSNSEKDRTEDGGRARVVEEGLSAWIFSIAKPDMFEGRDSLTFGMLKNIGQMVAGFEVEKCPLSLWEEAVLKGYEVFRQVRRQEGKCTIVGDRKKRTLTWK